MTSDDPSQLFNGTDGHQPVLQGFVDLLGVFRGSGNEENFDFIFFKCGDTDVLLVRLVRREIIKKDFREIY